VQPPEDDDVHFFNKKKSFTLRLLRSVMDAPDDERLALFLDDDDDARKPTDPSSLSSSLAHSPMLKAKLAALERALETRVVNQMDIASLVTHLADANRIAASKETALVKRWGKEPSCVDVIFDDETRRALDALDALAVERAGLADGLTGTVATGLRVKAEEEIAEVRRARRGLDAAKRAYDAARARQTRENNLKADALLKETKEEFERARMGLMIALQRAQMGKYVRMKRCARTLMEMHLEYFKRGLELLEQIAPTLDVMEEQCSRAERRNADLEDALRRAMTESIEMNETGPQTTAEALSMVSERSRSMSERMASTSLDGDDSSSAIMQGYLLKRSSGRLADWKRRYFVLDARGNLTYVKSQPSKARAFGLGALRDRFVNSSEANEIKETVSLLTATIKPELDDGSNARFAFRIVSPEKTYYLRAESASEQKLWIEAITTAIASLLNSSVSEQMLADHEERTSKYAGTHTRTLSSVAGNDASTATTLSILSELPGNSACADCGMPRPDWASLNLGVLLCIQCSGIHRQLGVHVSKVRSVTLDVRAWEPSVMEFFKRWGNEEANKRWEKRGKRRDLMESSLESKKAFILEKYVAKAFCERTSPASHAELMEAISTRRVPTLMDVLLKGCSVESHAAALIATLGNDESTNLALIEALIQHGFDVNDVDHAGESVLHHAMRRGLNETAKSVIAKGVKPHLANARGRTPFDVAVDERGAIRDDDLVLMLTTPSLD
jgi:Arf-GAP/coiled-coil/ANK repeat/PH domain-containing protein